MRRTLAVSVALAATLMGVGVPSSDASMAGAASTPVPSTASSVRCTRLGASGRTPVLLIPGTSLTPGTNYDWNYARAFRARKIPFCTVELPHHAMDDIQASAVYIAYAVRRMHAATGRRISVVGYSQGGMNIRWALKYWPHTRAMVDDVIGIDPSNHGSAIDPVCSVGCAPALWQQRSGSAFLRALNSGAETWRGISYTQVYTFTSELVVPNFGASASSPLRTGAGRISNIPVQKICPAHLAEHLTMGTIDPVAFAVVMDALMHSGPAQARRISPRVCSQAAMPDVERKALATNELRVATESATWLATYPHVSREPALKPYAR